MIKYETITDYFIEYEKTECLYKISTDWDVVKRYTDYLSLLHQLQKTGEYCAAVEYIAGTGTFPNIDTRGFTLFCKELFNNEINEHHRLAQDIVNISDDLNNEKKFVFSKMLSIYGEQLLPKINEKYACVRALRYEKIYIELINIGQSNIADIGCSEGRLEEHCMLRGLFPATSFRCGDKNYYILLQAQHRNRRNPSAHFFHMDIREPKDIDVLFDFNTIDGVVVVVSEVIEHMEEEVAFHLLLDILTKFRPKALLITTPNRDFSEIYKKDDPNNKVHTFEYRESEFINRMTQIAAFTKIYRLYEICGVAGDGVRAQSLFAGFIRI